MRRGSRLHGVRQPADGRSATGTLASFVLAFVVGLAWTFGLLYSAKGSIFLLTGEWVWPPFSGNTPDAFAVLAALPEAGPPAVLAASALPCVTLSLFARPALGRRPKRWRPRPKRWGSKQLPRLAGLALALVVFLVLGGAS